MATLLFECAIRAALIAAATALIVAALRVKAAAARHAAWTGVLVAMLLLPIWVQWGPKAAVRVLPPPAAAVAPTAVFDEPQAVAEVVPAPVPHVARRVVPWRESALGIYVVGALWLLLRLALGTVRANRLTSADCISPITVGLVRPRVILPAEWPQWPAERLAAVLAHENAHAQRRDPLVLWLALLNRAMFWFHPLAWWLEQRLAALAEEACDAAVLEQGHDAGDYAQCLIDTERSVMQAGARFAVIGMQMPGAALPHRVKLLFDGARPARISRPRAMLAVAACLSGGIVLGASSLERAELLKLERLPALILPKPPELVAQLQTRDPGVPAPAKPEPAFEVVAIRPAQPLTMALIQSGKVHGRVDDAGFEQSNIPLMSLIAMAYQTNQALISGPNWLNDEFFEVNAKLPAGSNKDQIPAMLRRMLADRFKLAVHHTPRVEDVYLLTVGKQGIKFQEASDDVPAEQKGCSQRPGHARCRSMTVSGWADNVSMMARNTAARGGFINDNFIDLPVVDETGLTGVYDFDLQWIPEQGVGGGRGGGIDPPDPSTKATTILQAVEAIGLRLERAKHSTDTIVVDHVEKTPTEN